MNKSSKIVFATAFLVIIVSATFLAAKKDSARVTAPAPIPSPSTAPSPSPSPVSSASPSSASLSYLSTKYGYSFSYPKQLSLGDSQNPLSPVSATTDSICVTRPGSGSCSFSARVMTTSGPQPLTASYVRSVYPAFDPRYETIAQASFGIGLSGIEVTNGGLRNFYVETPAGVVLDFSADTDYGAAILDTVALTR